jgi:hypothetical protein
MDDTYTDGILTNVNNDNNNNNDNNDNKFLSYDDDIDKIWKRMNVLRLNSSKSNKQVSFADELSKEENIDKMLEDQVNLWKSFSAIKKNSVTLTPAAGDKNNKIILKKEDTSSADFTPKVGDIESAESQQLFLP